MSRARLRKLAFGFVSIPAIGYAVAMLLYSPIQHMAERSGDPSSWITWASVVVSILWHIAYFIMFLFGGLVLVPIALVLLIVSCLPERSTRP